MSAVLATSQPNQDLSAADRALGVVARILNMCHRLEEQRDALLELLPTATDEVIVEIRMSARSVGVWAWLIECACDAEVLRRAERHKGGRGKRDVDGTGAKAAAGQQAYLDGKSPRTVERNAQIIKTFGTETCVTRGASLQDKGFFIAALSAPDPLKAIEIFEKEKVENPFFEVQDAWALVNEINAKEAKKKRKQERESKPSELVFIHTPEAQAYLDKCEKALFDLTSEIPDNVPSLRILNSRQREQIQWQKNRTVEGDCAAILELFTGTGKKGFIQVQYANESEIWNWLYLTNRIIDDPDLDDRLEMMSQCSRLEQESIQHNIDHPEDRKPTHKRMCQCEPQHKQLAQVPTGGRQETRRGDMVDLYMLYNQSTGEAAAVPHSQSRYDSGERE